jgi:multiple sugar transport system substrate-binding protein
MRGKWIIACSLFAVCLLLLTGISYGAEPMKRYEGATVTVVLHSGHFEIPWRARADRIKEMFGINLEVVGITVGDLFDKEMLELSIGTGAYDLLMFNPAWMGEFVDYLMPLDEYMDKWDPAWEDIHPAFQKWQNMYGGKRYSMTMDGDILMLYYRRDLFDDAKEKAAFKEKYGYDLRPPETWDQVIDIAEFFRRDTDGDGNVDFWGYADQGKRGRSFYWYLLRYLPYSSPDPHFFDTSTMKPLINSPEAVKALENYVKAVKLGPLGVLGWEWDELYNAFMQGKLAMSIHWPDEGKRHIELENAVPGALMGYALPPGARKDGKLHQHSSTGGGWILGMAKGSKNPEAAYMVMWYMLGPEVSLSLVLDPGTGQDLFRTSHFTSGVTKVIAPEDYLKVYNDCIGVLYPELRIPGTFEYYDTLDLYVQKALTGEVDAKAALDEVAKRWEKVTDRLGREKQLEKYRAAMGLSQ